MSYEIKVELEEVNPVTLSGSVSISDHEYEVTMVHNMVTDETYIHIKLCNSRSPRRLCTEDGGLDHNVGRLVDLCIGRV